MSLLILITQAVAQNVPADAPTDLTGKVGDFTVTLSWTPPSNTGSHPIIAYRYWVDELNFTNWKLVGGQFITVTTFTEVHTRNRILTYRIRAITGPADISFQIDGTPSERLKVTLKIPAPPNFKATLDDPTTGDRTATLSWTVPALTLRSGVPVTYQYSQNGGTWTSAGAGTSHRVTGYKRGDVFQILKEMEDPRVLRNVLLESFDWDAHYLRSEWTVPMPAPAAPSLVRKNIVGTWADVKKQ